MNSEHKTWSHSIENFNGKSLYNHILKRDFLIHAPSTPTLVHYRPDYERTTPNLVISKHVDKIANLRTLSALSSNHLSTCFTIEDEFLRMNPIIYKYSAADWSKYRGSLDANIPLSFTTYK